MLIHTSYLDIKYREVNPKIWLIYSPLILFFFINFQRLNLFLFFYSYIISSILIFIFYYFSLLGGADLFLLLILNLANAHVRSLLGDSYFINSGMEPLIVIIYSLIPIVIVGLGNLLFNLHKTPKDLSLKTRMTLAFSGRQMTIKEFLNSKFVFPLTEIDQNGSRQVRLSFSIEEDDSEWRKRYEKLLKEGLVREDEKIWVAWGVPVIPFILLGYSLLIIFGFPSFI